MCDYCFPPSNPTQITETTSVAGAYPSIKPPPPGVPVNALVATQILLDLIADLRELNQDRDGGMWADDVHDCADRAEQRLREMEDE